MRAGQTLVVRAVLLVVRPEDGRGVGLVLVLVGVLRRGGRGPRLAEQVHQLELDGRRLRLTQEAGSHHPGHRGDLHHVIVHAQVDALAVVRTLTLERRVGDDRHLRAVGRVLVELGLHLLARLVALDTRKNDQFERAVAAGGARLRDLDDEATVASLRMERGVALPDEASVVAVLKATALGRRCRRLLRRLEAAIAVHDEAVTDFLPRVEGRVQGQDGALVARLALLAPHLVDGPTGEGEDILGRKAGRLGQPGEDGGLLDLVVVVVAGGLGRLPEGRARRHGDSCCSGRGWLLFVTSDAEAQNTIPPRIGKPKV